jgi:hypothetical protein
MKDLIKIGWEYNEAGYPARIVFLADQSQLKTPIKFLNIVSAEAINQGMHLETV